MSAAPLIEHTGCVSTRAPRRTRAQSLGTCSSPSHLNSAQQSTPIEAASKATPHGSRVIRRRPVATLDSKQQVQTQDTDQIQTTALRPVSYPAILSDASSKMDAFSMRSPLQELEDNFTTKELKRAKLQDAERRALQRRAKRRSRNADASPFDSVESLELPYFSRHQRPQADQKPTEAAEGPRVHANRRLHVRSDDVSSRRQDNATLEEPHAVRAAAVAADICPAADSLGPADATDQQSLYLDAPRPCAHDAEPQKHAQRSGSDGNPRHRVHFLQADQHLDADPVNAQALHSLPPRMLPPADSVNDLETRHVNDDDDFVPLQEPHPDYLPSAAAPSSPPGRFARLKSAFTFQTHASKDRKNDRKEVLPGPGHTHFGSADELRSDEQIGPAPPAAAETGTAGDHRFSQIFEAHSEQDLEAELRSTPLEEWRKQSCARLTLDDFALDSAIVGSRSSRGSHSLDGTVDETQTSFSPPLFLKCGPLLRYTGMRRERRARPGHTTIIEREVWRGSVMIVTQDDKSVYSTAPTLRLFAQPQELRSRDHGEDLIAGGKTISRTGRTLYIKPVESLPPKEDLSGIENGRGLFDTKSFTPPPKAGRPVADGEKASKVRLVNGIRLHKERGLTFWRFQIEVELGTKQARVAYRINNGPATGFWVPGRNQSMNIMFYSCNGFSTSVDSKSFSGPEPLWRDVLNVHQVKPYHVMIGGGDQIYNDAIIRDTNLFRDWSITKSPQEKYKAVFTRRMQDELEESYLQRYCTWFSQGLFKVANSQIPMVNMWDDHDIIDGYGSYPNNLMASKVFSGLGHVAFKYYMLFQQQSVVSETYEHEQSWVLGSSPGPYISELSRSLFLFLGRKIALLALDCRTERMRDQVVSYETYKLALARCRSEIIRGETKHLLVLLGVPVAYPRLNFLENILTSKAMDPLKALGRAGVLGGFVNRFDGGVEILDDLDDHWTAKHHKKERKWFIQELQELAAAKSVRITILGGDVHLAGIGQFFTPEAQGVRKDEDHRYMLNVISSAIVNTPPPNMLADVLNKRNKTHHFDAATDETMRPIFQRDVDGMPRNNVHLLPRRNYCTISEHQSDLMGVHSREREQDRTEVDEEEEPIAESRRRYPPGSMGQSSHRKSNVQSRRATRRSSRSRDRESSQVLADSRPGNSAHVASTYVSDVPRHGRRQVSLASALTRSTSASRREDHDDNDDDDESVSSEGDHTDLEGGLDIMLNVEADQGDTTGVTVPYLTRLPALFYEEPGQADYPVRTRRPSIIDRLRSGSLRRRRSSGSERSRSSSQERLPHEVEADKFDGSNALVLAERVPRPYQHKRMPDARRDSQQNPYMSRSETTEQKSHESMTSEGRPDATARRSPSAASSDGSEDSVGSRSQRRWDRDHDDEDDERTTKPKNKLMAFLQAKRQEREVRRQAIERYEMYHAERLSRDRERERDQQQHARPVAVPVPAQTRPQRTPSTKLQKNRSLDRRPSLGRRRSDYDRDERRREQDGRRQQRQQYQRPLYAPAVFHDDEESDTPSEDDSLGSYSSDESIQGGRTRVRRSSRAMRDAAAAADKFYGPRSRTSAPAAKAGRRA